MLAMVGGERLPEYDPANREKYEEMCKRATELNTCVFVDGYCMANKQGCCTGCEHLAPEKGGCQISSLACKLWVCDDLRETLSQEVLTELQEIWDEARALGFLVVRDEPEFRQAWRVGFARPDGHCDWLELSSRTR
jgi:hypothetical protein